VSETPDKLVYSCRGKAEGWGKWRGRGSCEDGEALWRGGVCIEVIAVGLIWRGKSWKNDHESRDICTGRGYQHFSRDW